MKRVVTTCELCKNDMTGSGGYVLNIGCSDTPIDICHACALRLRFKTRTQVDIVTEALRCFINLK